MALTPLTDNNSFTRADGRVGVAVGNVAGTFRVARLNGTGTPQLTPSPFAVAAYNALVVYLGDSHIAGSVEAAPQYHFAPVLAASGSFVPYDQTAHVFAVGGYTANQIRTNSVPAAVAYINANKAGKSLVIAVLEGVINSTTYANYSAKQSIIDDIRASGNALAATGAKVVLLTTPPSHNNEATAPAQVAVIDQLRTEIDQDFIANTALYGAVAATASHTLDAELYPLRAYQTYPDRYADAVHYSFLGQALWGKRHLLPVLLDVMQQYAVPTPAPGGTEQAMVFAPGSRNIASTGNTWVASPPPTFVGDAMALPTKALAAGADGGVSLTLHTNVSHLPADHTLRPLDFAASYDSSWFAVRLSNNAYTIRFVESGAFVGNTVSYTDGQVLSIDRVGTDFVVKLDGTTIHTQAGYLASFQGVLTYQGVATGDNGGGESLTLHSPAALVDSNL